MTDSRKQQNKGNRVSDVVTSGVGEFYPDATKTQIEDIMDMGDVMILDAVIVEDFRTEYGIHPFAVVAVERDNDIFTFPTSGQVILAKIRELKQKDALPILGCFVKEKQYYDVK